VTADGNINLTKNVPKHPEEIEEIMANAKSKVKG
jgi:hypothetical protein